MKKFFHLSTCDTCKRIIAELDLPADFILQDIKTQALSEKDLEEMRHLTDSYEVLFSKRARLYKERNLKEKILSEEDYKALILEHYTFLKRPVLINESEIFVGNSKKSVEAAKASLQAL